MKWTLVLWAVLMFANFTLGQNAARRILETENHLVTVSTKDKSIVFTMEAVADFSHDRDNDRALGMGWDFAGIRVDVNNNNVIDNGVDVAFGTRQKSNIFCAQYIFHENASSGCGVLRSKGRARLDFKATTDQEKPHPIFVYEIPISELKVGGGTIGLVFQFYDAQNRRMATYPNRRNPRSFDETIQLDLADL